MKAVLEIFAALAIAFNKYMSQKRDDGLVDVGKELQKGENAKEGLDDLIEATKTRDDAKREFERDGVSVNDKYNRDNT